MPLAVAAPPQPVHVFSGFDYMTVDQTRHRVFAAHSRSEHLLIVDGTTGKIAGQVDTGPMHGVAVDPATGDVFTGNGTDQTVSKIDPVAMKVLASVDVPGNVDAIAYDPKAGRIYADQDGGGDVYIIDAATMKQLGSVPIPNADLESVAVDPTTGTVYQNLSKGGGFAIIDGAAMRVAKTVLTPQLERPHPLVFSAAAKQIVVGGVNGVMSAYTLDGTHVGDVKVQPRIDQCSTGDAGKLVACAGRGVITVLAPVSGAAPKLLATLDTGHPGIHTVGIDESTDDVWVVWSDDKGDWVQRLKWSP
jgi:DNA-binding beta-propeller fold protein YncE